jgi:hypothetical protein
MLKKMMMTAAAVLTLAAGAQAQTVSPNADMHGLESQFEWRRDNGLDLCSGRVTFTNRGNEAVGNIHYRTYYISETGVVHENSVIDAVIEKLIQPGQTRTIELEKFIVPEGTQAGINIKSCEALPKFTKPPAATILSSQSVSEYLQSYDAYISDFKVVYEAMKQGDLTKHQAIIQRAKELQAQGEKLGCELNADQQKQFADHLNKKADELAVFVKERK